MEVLVLNINEVFDFILIKSENIEIKRLQSLFNDLSSKGIFITGNQTINE